MSQTLTFYYGAQFILHSVLVFFVIKLLGILVPRINDISTWVIGIHHRLQQIRQEYGLEVRPEYDDPWFKTEVAFVFVHLILLQQMLIVFIFFDISCWNSMLTQIAIFHKRNPNVPRPKFSYEVLGCRLYYVIDYIFINLAIATALLFLDKKWGWMPPAGRGFRLAHFLIPAFIVYYVMERFKSFACQCAMSQSDLITVLEMNATVFFPVLKHENYSIEANPWHLFY